MPPLLCLRPEIETARERFDTGERWPTGASARAAMASWEVDDMMLRCDVLRLADELCSQAQYSPIIADVRRRCINYITLLDALPDCLLVCPLAAQMGDLVGPGCTNYDLAHDIFRTNARRLALG